MVFDLYGHPCAEHQGQHDLRMFPYYKAPYPCLDILLVNATLSAATFPLVGFPIIVKLSHPIST